MRSQFHLKLQLLRLVLAETAALVPQGSSGRGRWWWWCCYLLVRGWTHAHAMALGVLCAYLVAAEAAAPARRRRRRIERVVSLSPCQRLCLRSRTACGHVLRTWARRKRLAAAEQRTQEPEAAHAGSRRWWRSGWWCCDCSRLLLSALRCGECCRWRCRLECGSEKFPPRAM